MTIFTLQQDLEEGFTGCSVTPTVYLWNVLVLDLSMAFDCLV